MSEQEAVFLDSFMSVRLNDEQRMFLEFLSEKKGKKVPFLIRDIIIGIIDDFKKNSPELCDDQGNLEFVPVVA